MWGGGAMRPICVSGEGGRDTSGSREILRIAEEDTFGSRCFGTRSRKGTFHGFPTKCYTFSLFSHKVADSRTSHVALSPSMKVGGAHTRPHSHRSHSLTDLTVAEERW